jgi:polyferredoxin
MSFQAKRRAQEKRKRRAWFPIFGFVIMVVFGAFAWAVTPYARPYAESFIDFPNAWPPLYGDAIIGTLIFIVLFAFAMVLAAVFAGSASKDPYDVNMSGKQMKKRIDERAARKRRY